MENYPKSIFSVRSILVGTFLKNYSEKTFEKDRFSPIWAKALKTCQLCRPVSQKRLDSTRNDSFCWDPTPPPNAVKPGNVEICDEECGLWSNACQGQRLRKKVN